MTAYFIIYADTIVIKRLAKQEKTRTQLLWAGSIAKWT